jgi:hypothetical protein
MAYFKHGWSTTPTYNSWRSMRHRCDNESNVGYAQYGGRGISYCERWALFENFLADMGERPEGKTLDRIDPDGNYEPSNCRWATVSEQIWSRRTSTLINGVPLGQLAAEHGINPKLLRKRLVAGWALEKALTTPSRRPRRPPRQRDAAAPQPSA